MTSDISCSSPRKEAYSASVKDVLGENSSVLGWALAVGGGAAGLGICGVAGRARAVEWENTLGVS